MSQQKIPDEMNNWAVETRAEKRRFDQGFFEIGRLLESTRALFSVDTAIKRIKIHCIFTSYC